MSYWLFIAAMLAVYALFFGWLYGKHFLKARWWASRKGVHWHSAAIMPIEHREMPKLHLLDLAIGESADIDSFEVLLDKKGRAFVNLKAEIKTPGWHTIHAELTADGWTLSVPEDDKYPVIFYKRSKMFGRYAPVIKILHRSVSEHASLT